MSKLERFIEDNREAFDDKLPAGKVWETVEAAVIKKEKKHFLAVPFYKWGIAASVVVLIGISALLMKRTPKPAVLAENKGVAVVDSAVYTMAPEEAPQMAQFAKLIETKQEQLKVFSKEQPELYKKFTADFIQLDSSYNALKTQLAATPNKETLIEAMIQNLQLQLNVLNQQLNIINQIKNLKSNSHEKNNQFM